MPQGRCRPLGLWLQAPWPLSASLAAAVVLSPWTDSSLLGCVFGPQGWCWPFGLWLSAPGLVPASRVVAVDLGPKLVLASCATAGALGLRASAGLSGCGFWPWGHCWPLGL